VILLSTWVYEHLEMSILCVGMLLGLPHHEMTGWGVFISSPTILVVGQKQQLSVDGHTGQSDAHQACTVHCPVPCPCQPTIGVCSSRPLDPTVIQIVRCTLDSLVLQPKSARCGSLCTDCPVSHQIVRCTLNRLLFVSSAPPVRWLTATFMDFFPDSLGFFCS
jgi:hypothetical protein